LHERITTRVASLRGLTLRRSPDPAGNFGFELYLFLADAAQATAFREKLDARNVNCGQRTGTYPQYHRDYVKNGRAHAPGASPFRGLEPWPAPGYRAEDFPRTEQLTRRFVAIPLGWLYTIEDADHIAASISAVHQELFPAL
jgi:dTDP-4-amino-4,6-dideoxygalactose transaminase